MHVANIKIIKSIEASFLLNLLIVEVSFVVLLGFGLFFGKNEPILDLYSLSEQHILQYNVTYFIYSDVGLVAPPVG